MAENARTTTARDTDDHELIEQAVADSDGGGTASGTTAGGKGGGALARDVGSADDLAHDVGDADTHTRATRQNDVDAGVARPSDRRGDNG